MDGWQQLTLLDDLVDHKATQEQVQEFLKRGYPKAKRIAGRDLTNIQSPQITDMPKGTPNGNANENKLINRAAARQIVNHTRQAIAACDRDSQTILTMMAQGYKTKEIIAAIGWSKSQYHDVYRPRALEQFAQAYQGEAIILK